MSWHFNIVEGTYPPPYEKTKCFGIKEVYYTGKDNPKKITLWSKDWLFGPYCTKEDLIETLKLMLSDSERPVIKEEDLSQ